MNGLVFTVALTMLILLGIRVYSPHFKELHQRFGAPRIVLLPIGAYMNRVS